MTLKFLSLKRFDSSSHNSSKCKATNELPPSLQIPAPVFIPPTNGPLLALQDATITLIITHVQATGSRQSLAALRATCQRLRVLVNRTCTTLQVNTDQVTLVGDLSAPHRGFERCTRIRLIHRLIEAPFPSHSIIKMAQALGVKLHGSSLGSAETPLSPGLTTVSSSALLLTSSSSSSVAASPKQLQRSRSKAAVRRSFTGCSGGCFFHQPVADDFHPERVGVPESLTSFVFPEPMVYATLTHLQLVYTSSGPPNLQPLLLACAQMTRLQTLEITRMPCTAHTQAPDQPPPTLTCPSSDVQQMVSSVQWDCLPPSITTLHLDVPYWETALPSLSHLTALHTFHGDKKAHFQDLEYWRSPLPASLPESVQDLRGLHVTTYADLLKVAALTNLTHLEFQSLNWDWNDPIMGGPNSLNIALKMLTALKGLHWLSIKQDSKASVVEKNTLEWMAKLGSLRHLELRGCKLFPEVLLPVLSQMGSVTSFTLDDCVDFHTGPGQNAWPEVFQNTSFTELRLEVPGLHNTGPDYGGCALEKGIFQCFTPNSPCTGATALHTLHLGCVQAADAQWLLDPLSSLSNLRNLSLSLQEVTFQVASKLNILSQVTRVDLLLKLPEATTTQPDISGFVSCLGDPSKYHWQSVPLAPLLLTTVSSVRDTLRALQGLANFDHIHSLSIPIKVDWPTDRPLDPLHLKSFAHLCHAVAQLKGLERLIIDVQGVFPSNLDIYEPLLQLGDLPELKQGRLIMRDVQRMHIGSMFRLAVKRLSARGVPLMLQEPVADFRLGRSRVMSETQKIFTLVPSIIC